MLTTDGYYISNHTTRQKFEMVFMNLQKGGLNPLIPSVGINSDAWDEKMSSVKRWKKSSDFS